MKTAAFFFDLDGTLVDTEAYWSRAMVDMIRSHGAEATLEEILPAIVGRNWIDIDHELHRRYPVLGAVDPEKDAVALREYYKRYASIPKTIPSSVEFFRMAAAFAPCAIVSGSPHDDVVEAARDCGISDCVSFVLGAGEYEAGKPSPSGYLKAAQIAGVDPSQCVVIEDSTVGVASGVAAGMKVVALDRGTTQVPQTFHGATWVVHDLLELELPL